MELARRTYKYVVSVASKLLNIFMDPLNSGSYVEQRERRLLHGARLGVWGFKVTRQLQAQRIDPRFSEWGWFTSKDVDTVVDGDDNMLLGT